MGSEMCIRDRTNTAVTHRILSFRKMIAGGDEMKPPPNSLYRNFTLYIWWQLSAWTFCISVLVPHDDFAVQSLFGIVL